MSDTQGVHMQIGQVAAQTQLSIRTVRHYDDVGLVTPSARSAGGFRLYADADVDRLLVIRRMKPLGFTLAEMKIFSPRWMCWTTRKPQQPNASRRSNACVSTALKPMTALTGCASSWPTPRSSRNCWLTARKPKSARADAHPHTSPPAEHRPNRPYWISCPGGLWPSASARVVQNRASSTVTSIKAASIAPRGNHGFSP